MGWVDEDYDFISYGLVWLGSVTDSPFLYC